MLRWEAGNGAPIATFGTVIAANTKCIIYVAIKHTLLYTWFYS